MELLSMTGGTSVERKEAGEEVREFTNELVGDKCDQLLVFSTYLIDLREPQRELKRDSPGEEGGVAKL